MAAPEPVAKSKSIVWLPVALLLLGGIGYLEYFVRAELTLSVLYLAPAGLAAWYTGRLAGIVVAVLCAAAHLAAAGILDAGHVRLAVPCWNSVMLLGFLLTAAILLSQLKQVQGREQFLSRNDTVTTALNSRYFYELLQTEIDRAKRYERHFTLIYIDIDDFKKVNEAFGRKEGDSALWHCVVTITGVLRKTDIVGRLGGDEFACLLPETGFDAAGAAIQRLRSALQKEMVVHKWATSVSMAAITFAGSPGKSDDAIRQVDALLGQVKKAGKNGVEHKVFV